MIHVYAREVGSPIGPLVLTATEIGICGIEFGTWVDSLPSLEKWCRKTCGEFQLLLAPQGVSPHLDKAEQQLEAYFRGDSRLFDLDLDLRGTSFQVGVWQALTRIPYGETRSYKDIAGQVGSPKAVRAVGGANNRNPIPIIVPCHRVIGAGGQLVGYGGGLSIKTFLLQHEGLSTP